MKQHIVQDQATVQYAGGLEAVWAEWEPALLRAEALLRSVDPEAAGGDDLLPELLRRAQYRAHTASEFVCGLRPPLAAVDAHEYLVSTLDACRDTFGVLAIRAELDDLDDGSIDVGLHAVGATREAFRAARSSSVAAYHFSESMRPIYVEPAQREPGGMGVLLWSLVGICAVLFTVLLFEVFLLTAPA